jgi:hypothetical protein
MISSIFQLILRTSVMWAMLSSIWLIHST